MVLIESEAMVEIKPGYLFLNEVKAMWHMYIAEIGIDLGFQDFETELATLPGKYDLPFGRLYVALANNQVVGCVALRKIDEKTAEVKRLYIHPSYRNQKIATILVEKIIDEARLIGYHHLVLDTLENMLAARRLYESFGFKQIYPYYDSPLTNAIYYQLDLL